MVEVGEEKEAPAEVSLGISRSSKGSFVGRKAELHLSPNGQQWKLCGFYRSLLLSLSDL